MILLGSGNRHKLFEFQRILSDLGIDVASSELIPDCPDVVEDADTFLGNAGLKARGYAEAVRAQAAEISGTLPVWVVADDSGLCVDALDGAPGIFSARYAGPGCTFEDNNRKLLGALEGREDRSAHFVCAISCARVPAPGEPAEVVLEVEGRCDGTIATEIRGAEGFGYDPVFIVGSTGKTFAEMPADEKNAISHRGEALRLFREAFEKLS